MLIGDEIDTDSEVLDRLILCDGLGSFGNGHRGGDGRGEHGLCCQQKRRGNTGKQVSIHGEFLKMNGTCCDNYRELRERVSREKRFVADSLGVRNYWRIFVK